MLDERKTAILRAVVQEYITTAQPVGSRTWPPRPACGVSPATVRNEMAVLEQEGYLAQPHTSAGRIPTDKGYRFFVDHLDARPADSTRATRTRSATSSSTAHGRLEELLASTTTCSPGHPACGGRGRAAGRRPPVRSVQLVGLSARLAMVVAVLSNGNVESQTIELDDDLSPSRRRGRDGAPPGSVGRPHDRRPADAGPTGDPALDALCAAALAALRRAGDGRACLRRRRGVDGRRLRRRRYRCARCCTRSSSSTSWSSLVRDVLDRGLTRGDRGRTRRRAARRVLGGASPPSSSTASSWHRRRARPDADGLPAGPGDGRRRQRAARSAAGRRMIMMDRSSTLRQTADGWPITTSCWASARNASADEIKKAYRRRARDLHPGRESRPGGGGGVQGGRPRLRGAERPRPAGPLRPVRRGRRRGRGRRRPVRRRRSR